MLFVIFPKENNNRINNNYYANNFLHGGNYCFSHLTNRKRNRNAVSTWTRFRFVADFSAIMVVLVPKVLLTVNILTHFTKVKEGVVGGKDRRGNTVREV